MSAECHDEMCITCSDQLLTILVTGVDKAAGTARGTINGLGAEVGTDLLDGVTIGDVLLCHGGVALQRCDPVEAGA
ncbi:MAG TPA: HypC/HybG/HupF family hydrogenase formation chaperone [Candidatus Saccharimonadales bacterium]|nr:HypC/HybG/HupF family hydrogenase formation chaperone [Candidatus Saccharimonadales bacterium]